MRVEPFAIAIPDPVAPGYGFSERPRRPGMTTRALAPLWDELMQGLGYPRYGAGGTDFGAGVTTYMALDRPAPLTGIHLTFLEEPAFTGPGSRPLSDLERAYLEENRRWLQSEYAYAERSAAWSPAGRSRTSSCPRGGRPGLARDIGAFFGSLA